MAYWQVVVTAWVLHRTPRDGGFFRSRWTCAVLAQVLKEEYDIHASPENVRSRLHQNQMGFA